MQLLKLLKFLQCPYCCSRLTIKGKASLKCPSCKTDYPVICGIPVLINPTRLNPQENQQQAWFNNHYSKFSNDKYELENWRLSMLDRIFTSVSGNNVKTYLDIGCGATGYTVIEAAKKMGWLSFGADISIQAMIRAKTLAQKEGVDEQTGFVVCSAEHLPFKNRVFDYVSAISVLEHLEEDKKTVVEIVNKLTDNGYFYVCVPNTYKRMWPFLWPVYKYIDYKIGHKRHYSIEGLNKIMPDGLILKKIIYNAHLIKLLQYVLEKLGMISDHQWWLMEKRDISKNSFSIQLNAVYQKTK